MYQVRITYTSYFIIFVKFWYLFFAHSSCMRTVRTNMQTRSRGSTGDGHPDTVVEVWARSVQCVARGVLSKVFFSAGGDKTISRVSLLGVILYQVPSIFRSVDVFCSYLFCLKTARLATTPGSLCRDRFGVQYHPRLGALRAVCRV